jgi:hypothetical protein
MYWKTIPTSPLTPSDIIFGSNAAPGAAQSNLQSKIGPTTSHICGSKMFVADPDRNRVLMWSNYSAKSHLKPDIVLGQPNMYSTSINAGGGSTATASTMYGPRGVFCDGTKLYVGDTLNNRVLIWNTLPTVSGQAANVVIGQPDMATTSSGTSSTKFYSPDGIWTNGTLLYITDFNNYRVLGYNAVPTTNGAAANFVLGQGNMTTRSSGCSATTLYTPRFISSIGSKLLVADASNFRVLVWNTLPTTTAAAADFVIGQPNLTTCSSGATASKISFPGGFATDGTKFYLIDNNNSRLLTFNTLPSSNGATADAVYGQPNFTSSAQNAGQVIQNQPRNFMSETMLYSPEGLHYSGGYLYISDYSNSRLMAIPAP